MPAKLFHRGLEALQATMLCVSPCLAWNWALKLELEQLVVILFLRAWVEHIVVEAASIVRSDKRSSSCM